MRNTATTDGRQCCSAIDVLIEQIRLAREHIDERLNLGCSAPPRHNLRGVFRSNTPSSRWQLGSKNLCFSRPKGCRLPGLLLSTGSRKRRS
jgi:hypothetical protein